MANKMMKYLGVLFAFSGMTLIPATLSAQGSEAVGRHSVREMPLRARMHTQTVAYLAQPADAPAYNYTLISFPGTLNTEGVGINLGAIAWNGKNPGLDIVGAEVFPDGLSQTGFFAHASETNGVTENYSLLNDPRAPTPQQAYSVNDYGQIVGDYIDAAGTFHSYMLDGGQYKKFDVPFTGATGTYSPAINNAGEIVGSWNDAAGNAHGYTLIQGTFVSFDYPGAAQAQFYYGINNEGDITGSYADASGNIHGFLRKGKTYTSIDYPGAVYTGPSGINDAGDIVGSYCLTTQCLDTAEGEQGFLLKKGVFTVITIPGEFGLGLAGIDNEGVLMGNYIDAAGLVYTFLATPK